MFHAFQRSNWTGIVCLWWAPEKLLQTVAFFDASMCWNIFFKLLCGSLRKSYKCSKGICLLLNNHCVFVSQGLLNSLWELSPQIKTTFPYKGTSSLLRTCSGGCIKTGTKGLSDFARAFAQTLFSSDTWVRSVVFSLTALKPNPSRAFCWLL